MSTIAPIRHRTESDESRLLTRQKTLHRQAILELQNLLRTKLTATHERAVRRELAEHQKKLEDLQ